MSQRHLAVQEVFRKFVCVCVCFFSYVPFLLPKILLDQLPEIGDWTTGEKDLTN